MFLLGVLLPANSQKRRNTNYEKELIFHRLKRRFTVWCHVVRRNIILWLLASATYRFRSDTLATAKLNVAVYLAILCTRKVRCVCVEHWQTGAGGSPFVG